MASRTWDGQPVSEELPFGVTVIVFRPVPDLQLLLLHRVAPGVDEGDWAWTPPAGARKPDEPVLGTARRELWEEAGFRLRTVGCR